MNYKRWNELQRYEKENEVIEGRVKVIKPYGAFIELSNGTTGLLPIENICVSRIRSPYDCIQVGEKIKVRIQSLDEKKKRVLLTHKELLGTWEDNVKTVKEGSQMVAVVREKEQKKNGVFIELKPNLVGMAEYDENLHYGEQVKVYIKKIDAQKKKIKVAVVDEMTNLDDCVNSLYNRNEVEESFE